MVMPPTDVATLWYPDVDHAEGCAVDSAGTIWAGGEGGQIYRGRLDERPTTVAVLPGRVLGMVTDAQGNLICATETVSALWRVTPSGQVDLLCDQIDGRPLRVPNHPAFLPGGLLLFTDSGGWGDDDGFTAALDADGTATIVDTTCSRFPNGIFVSPDGATVYVVESTLPGVSTLQVGADGSLHSRLVLIELPGIIPDGVLLDESGAVIVTCFSPDQLLVVDDGVVSVVAADPTRFVLHSPTNAAFLPDSTTLVVANYGERQLALVEHSRAGSAVHRPLFAWSPAASSTSPHSQVTSTKGAS